MIREESCGVFLFSKRSIWESDDILVSPHQSVADCNLKPTMIQQQSFTWERTDLPFELCWCVILKIVVRVEETVVYQRIA